jgi:hypothetical protein
LEINSNGKREKSNGRSKSKSLCYEVRVVPLDTYPDLKVNPGNPYTQMTDDERMDELIDLLGLLWAETCLDEAAKCPRLTKGGGKRPEFSIENKGSKRYSVTQANL